MACKERYIIYALIVHCCIVSCWIMYRKLAQPTEADL